MPGSSNETANQPMNKRYTHDVLVIGSGAAGASLALRLADNYRVAVLSKGPLRSGSTWYAQGGVAVVLDDEDSMESHVQDTLVAGGGLCHEDAVRFTVENGPTVINWLVEMGMDFTRDETGEFHLTREGGHSHRRILHTADATGKAVSTTLIEKLVSHPNIEIFEDHIIVDLITQSDHNSRKLRCSGAYVLDRSHDHVCAFEARCVVLATGGASKVYLYTSSPDGATGDGIAAAWRKGCRIANMEFNQFHPTCLFHPQSPAFLPTEALRGEGAYLR